MISPGPINTNTINTGILYFQGVSTGLKANDPLLLDFGNAQPVVYVKTIEADFPNNRTKVVLMDSAITAVRWQTTLTPSTLRPQAKTSSVSPPTVFDGLVKPLAIPPTPQLAASAFLQRNLDTSFQQTSDSLPQLVSFLKPSIANTVYPAWANAVTAPATPPRIYAFRVKAAPFGSTAPLKQITDDQGRVIGSEEWPLAGAVTIGVNTSDVFSLIRVLTSDLLPTSVPVELSVNDGNHSVIVNTNLGNTKPIPLNLDNNSIWEATISVEPVGTTTRSVTINFSSGTTTNQVKITADAVTNPNIVMITVNGDTLGPDESIRYRGSNGDISIEYSEQNNTLVFSQQTPLPANPKILDLDAQYDQIIANNTPVVIVRSNDEGIPSPLVSHISDTQIISKTAYNLSGKSTELTLIDNWLGGGDLYLSDIRDATVYAQSEELQLSDLPISPMNLGEAIVIKADTIELGRIYDGLESGRWIIVSGQLAEATNSGRTGNTSVSELAVIAQVSKTGKLLDHTALTLVKPLAYSYVRGAVSISTTVDIQGDSIELQQLYDGLQSGRWIVVSGERTDVINPDGSIIAGIKANELAMIAAVNQAPGSLPGDRVHTTLTLAKNLAYAYKLDSVAFNANVVKATHGETRIETLGAGDSSQAFQAFSLKQSPLTFVSAANPAGVDSTLKVYVNNVAWTEADSLSGQGAKDRVFISETDDNDKTTITFGNGIQGTRLPTGLENIKAVYRNGIGKPGNVNAGQITLLQTRPLGVKAVNNPLQASGGADKESRDQARENVPLAVQALDRLVSVSDYADFTRTFAGIGKAVAGKLSNGRRQLVYITVAGADDIPIDTTSDLYRNLLAALRQLGDPDLALQVAMRELIVLVVSANIRLVAGYLWEPVKANITAAILDAFGFQRRALGQPALLCELIALMQNIPGVEYVDVDSFNGIPEIVTNSGDASRRFPTLNEISTALANTANPPPEYIPVNDAGADKNGGLHPAQLAIFTASVPDSIVLNQIS